MALQKRHFPSLVSRVAGIEDGKKGRKQTWQELQKVSSDLRALVYSDETAFFIQDIEQSNNLPPDKTAVISRLFRGLVIGSLTPQEVILELTKSLSLGNEKAAEIQTQISSLLRQGHKEKEISFLSLLLKDIAEQYPKALAENIGLNPITLGQTQKILKPTLQNWVVAYTKIEGVMQHDDLTRGNFVYRSQITRSLTTDDRKKLIALLTAYDRATPLKLDSETKTIIWESSSEESSLSEVSRRTVRQNYADRSRYISPIRSHSNPSTLSSPTLNSEKRAIETDPSSHSIHKAEHSKNDDALSNGPRERNARIQAIKDGVPQAAAKQKSSHTAPLGSSARQKPAQSPPSSTVPTNPSQKQDAQFELETPRISDQMHMSAREKGWVKKAHKKASASSSQLSDTKIVEKYTAPKVLPSQIQPAYKKSEPEVVFTSGQTLPDTNNKVKPKDKPHSPFHISPVKKR